VNRCADKVTTMNDREKRVSMPSSDHFAEFIGNDVFKDERKNVYFNPEGADRPLKSPIAQTVVAAARSYRMQRLRQKLADNRQFKIYDDIEMPNVDVLTER